MPSDILEMFSHICLMHLYILIDPKAVPRFLAVPLPGGTRVFHNWTEPEIYDTGPITG